MGAFGLVVSCAKKTNNPAHSKGSPNRVRETAAPLEGWVIS